MRAAVEGEGGVVNNDLGDGVLAIFGVPIARESDPMCAIRAAIHIRRELRSLDLDSTAGIATGDVFLDYTSPGGDPGVPRAGGRVVNLASRLQGAAAPGQILVADSTYRLAGHAFRFDATTPVVKGVEEPLKAHAVLETLARPGLRSGPEGLRAPLHGREAEMGVLRGGLDGLGRGRGGLIAVAGQAGVGKSRLKDELHQALGRHGPGEPLWLEGRCLESGASTGYLPYRGMIEDLLAFRSGDSDEGRRRKLGAYLDTLRDKGHLEGDRADELAPLIARMLSVSPAPEDADALAGMGPEQLKNETFAAVRDLMAAVSRDRPLLLVIEDMHWADALSLGLTGLIFELAAIEPILVLVTSRPWPEHRWRRLSRLAHERCGERTTIIELSELPDDTSRELVQSLVGAQSLPSDLIDPILERAEGNPFFLEEMFRSLIESEVIVRHIGGWEARADVALPDAPESIQAVILSRVDRLGNRERGVLGAAAVIGRHFPRWLLAHLWDDEDELEQALWELERRQLIVSDESAWEEEYAFNHVLTQETIYRSLSQRRRAEGHQLVAEAIESASGDGIEARYELLAYHYERGTDPERAVDYLLLAGEKSRRAYLNEAAADSFLRALERLEGMDSSGRAGWHRSATVLARERLGDVRALSGKHEEAFDAYTGALQHLGVPQGPAAGRIHRKLGKSLQVQRRADEAFLALEEAQRALGPKPPGPDGEWWSERVDIALDRVLLAYFAAPTQKMDALASEATELVDHFGTPAQRANLLHLRALVTLRQRRYRADDDTVELARSAAEASVAVNPADMGMTRFIHGFALLWADRLGEAEGELLGTLDRAERVGDVTLQSRCLTYETLVRRKLGDATGVRDWALRALRVADAGGMTEYQAQANANLSWSARRENDHDGFERHARLGWELWQRLPPHGPYDYLQWIAEWPAFALAVSEARAADAVAHARSLVDPARHPMPERLVRAINAAMSADGADEALPHLEAIIPLAEEDGYL